MEPQAKRMRLSSTNEELYSAGSDSELDSNDEAEAYGGLNVKEAMARLRSALLQLPSRTARRDCVVVQEWVKDLLIPSDFSQSDKSYLGTGAVMELFENGLLQLLPKLLQAQHEHIVLGALEVVGALALHSTDTNEKLACSKPVISTITDLLECRRLSVMMATCNCINDIMVAPTGCRAFVDSATLGSLMRLLCWTTDRYLPGNPPLNGCHQSTSVLVNHVRTQRHEAETAVFAAVNVCLDDVHDVLLPVELEELFGTVIQATGQLLAYSPTPVSSDLLTVTLSKLQLMWRRMKPESGKQSDLTTSDSLALSKEAHSQRQAVASLVARFAMEAEFLSGYRCISRLTNNDLQEAIPSGFFEEFWEFAPALIRGGSETGRQSLLSCLKEVLWQSDSEDFLVRLLSGMTACPPIPADEVDPLNIFKDLQRSVGEPVRYGHDVRLVKSRDGNERNKTTSLIEHHYCPGKKSGDHSASRTEVRIEDCVQGFKLGYTVALRGMEFRFPPIAAIADLLATALGQASVGANLYLTPANAQGLASHYDDHCVLICQVYGHKHWSIYSPEHVLPRLYNNRCPVKQNTSPVVEVRVDQGDWLYIPRGFAHQAHTCNQCMGETDPPGSRLGEKQSFSLHLTFGVEVEAPFEWEGLIHIALHCFGRRRVSVTANDRARGLDAHLSQKKVHLIIILLHIAAREVGKECPGFRKACTIAATLPEASISVQIKETPLVPTCSDCKLQDSRLHLSTENFTPESFFLRLLALFSEQASFDTAQKIMTSSLAENRDGLSWMAWLRHVPSSWEDFYSAASYAPLHQLLAESSQPGCPDGLTILSLESQFTSMKEEFVREALYPEACSAFELVLGKYRDSRKKLINALLALHADMFLNDNM